MIAVMKSGMGGRAMATEVRTTFATALDPGLNTQTPEASLRAIPPVEPHEWLSPSDGFPGEDVPQKNHPPPP
jgi:hypothetical protein